MTTLIDIEIRVYGWANKSYDFTKRKLEVLHLRKRRFRKFTAATMLLSTFGSVGAGVLLAPTAYADEVEVSAKMTHERFVEEIGPLAQKIAYKADLYASVMIAQAIIESNWGENAMAQSPNHNLFGVKASHDGQDIALVGSDVKVKLPTIAGLKQYGSYEESLEENAQLMSSELTNSILRSETETYEDTTLVISQMKGVESLLDGEKSYNERLNSLIKENDLTKYDSKPKDEKEDDDKLVIPEGIEEVKPDFKVRDVTSVKDVTYSTKENDSLWGVAREHQVSIGQLQEWNEELSEIGTVSLPEGIELKVNEAETIHKEAYRVTPKVEDVVYTVTNGDYVAKIANLYEVSIDELHSMNDDLREDNIIYVGQEIKVEEGTGEIEEILNEEQQLKLIEEAREETIKLIEADKAEKAAAAEAAKIAEEQAKAPVNGVAPADASETASKLIALAYEQIGKPYTQGPGRQGPHAFDCSGLTQYLFLNVAGIDIGSWTVPQESSGQQVSVSEARPGDLYFWGGRGGTTHVALAIGNGEYIHSPTFGETVKVGNTTWFTPDWAVRVLP